MSVSLFRLLAAAVICCAAAPGLVLAGTLTPPAGPVGATMKSLDQIEPGTPIESLSGTATEEFIISEPGRYYLTRNHQIAGGKSGISITTSHVTLDLSGFRIECTSATAGQTYNGIVSTLDYVRVLNGSVSKFPFAGVMLTGSGCTISEVSSSDNGILGIYGGAGCQIMRCTVAANGGLDSGQGAYGIVGQANSIISENNISGTNGISGASSVGLQAGSRSLVTRNIITGGQATGSAATAYGIYAHSSQVMHNQVSGPTGENGAKVTGIYAQSLSYLAFNSVVSPSSWSGDTARGIEAEGRSNVHDNHITQVGLIQGDGTAYGIYAHEQVRVVNNTVTHTMGIISGNVNAYNIYLAGQQCVADGNQCQNPVPQGSGVAANIWGGHLSKISNNFCGSSVDTANKYGILINGNSCVVTGNTCERNTAGDIHFDGTSERGYAAGNITSNAVSQDGGLTNVLNGTTPAPNVVH